MLYEQAALYILAGGEHLDKEREDVEASWERVGAPLLMEDLRKADNLKDV